MFFNRALNNKLLISQLTSPPVSGTTSHLDSANSALTAILPRSPLPYNSLGPLSPGRTAARSPVAVGGPPVRKRMKLDLDPGSTSPGVIRKRLGECRVARMRKLTGQYRDNMAELYFLQSGNICLYYYYLFERFLPFVFRLQQWPCLG